MLYDYLLIAIAVLVTIGAFLLGITISWLAKGYVEDYIENAAYAKSVSHFPTALKEFEWRNGYFTGLTMEAVSKLQPDPCPAHTEIMISEGLYTP